MRRNDVASTSFRRRVPTRFLINQCQIITFLILKYDIENSRIELRGIVLPVQVGGGQRVCQIIGGGLAPPAPPPSSYAYDAKFQENLFSNNEIKSFFFALHFFAKDLDIQSIPIQGIITDLAEIYQTQQPLFHDNVSFL